ncbi:UNVERIFIED_CONTAM: protein dehydration-induced [Sesamum radiatum]|uniref:Protein dehydration-induced n=1 Tax=Sesamum radiatum TaxID=300843 RepID=A0AAW2WHW9_SESRA
MDVDFWAARVHRHIPSVQSARVSNFGRGLWWEGPVCPVCAANLGKDPLAHFTVQHAHSIKRRKKSQKSGFWSNVSTNIVKDLRELSSFLGANSLSGPPSGNEPAPDPLLSPFLCTVPLTVSKDLQKDTSSCITATSDAESSKLSPPDEVDGKDHEERRQRAAFLQELLLSTIF